MSESIITRYGIDTSGAEGAVSELTKLYLENAAAAERSQKESASLYQNAARQTGSYQQTLQKVRAEVTAQVQVMKVLEREHARLEAAQKKTTNPATLKAMGDRLDIIKKKLSEIRGETEKVGKAGKEAAGAGGMGGLFQMIKGAGVVGAALWAAGKVKEFIGNVITVRSEFAKYEAVLKSAYKGNEAFAAGAIGMIKDYAAVTNFSVAEVTASFIKLKSAGFEPTREELTKLGDLANFKGKSFDQLTEAVLDAQSFEFERLREFGIRAKQSGDQIEVTFNNQTKTIDKSSAAVKDYILSLGELPEVMGTTSGIAKTLEGRISNMGDAWNSFFDTIGQRSEGVIGGLIELTTDAVNALTELVKSADQKMADVAQKQALAFGDTYKKATAEQRKSMRDALVQDQKDAVEALKANLEKQKQLAAAPKVMTSSGQMVRTNQVQINQAEAEEQQLRQQIRASKAQIAVVQKTSVDEREARKLANDAKAQEQKAADEKAAKDGIAAAKKYAAARKQLEKDLQQELMDLEKQYNEARINLLDDNGEAALAETRRQAMAEIDEMVAQIEALNVKLGKPKDLSTEQKSQVSTLRQSVDKDYVDGLEEITMQRNQRIFDLQAESDAKEMAALQRKYDQMERAAKGNADEFVAITLARFREVEALELKQAQQDIGQRQEVAILGVQAGAVVGKGEDAAAVQEAAEKKILEIRRKYAKEELALLKGRTDAESTLRKAELEATITDITNAQTALKAQESKFSMAKLFGLSEAQFSIVKEQFEQILGNISQIAAAKAQAAEEAVQAKNKELDNAESELDRELQLNKQGFASNVEGKRKEVADLKKERDKALADQKKAQKVQALVDGTQSAISMITATANIFKSLSPLPLGLGVPLGIAAVGSMFAAFIATKAKAGASTKFRTGGKLPGGLVSGPGHDHGGVRGTGAFGDVEVEGGEHITRKASTEKFWPLLQAINEDTPSVWQQKSGSIARLLEGAGVTLSLPNREETLLATSLPEQVRVAEKTEGMDGLRAELKQVNRQLAILQNINANTGRLPRRTYTPLPDGRVVVQEGNTITTISQ